MKGINQQGQAVYYNVVTKHGKVRYQIQAASGQTLQGRDRQKRKSRTFAQEHQAAAWMKRNGYEICGQSFTVGKNSNGRRRGYIRIPPVSIEAQRAKEKPQP